MEEKSKAYWNDTLKLIFSVLVVWFLVSYGAGIMFVEALNNIQIGGYPLGFWFAHQGSMYAFVIMIFVYAKLIGKLDEKYDVHED